MKIEKNTGRWTAAEDRIIAAGVGKYGLNSWSKVASLVSRTPEQCRHRYENQKTKWNSADVLELLRLYKALPLQYALIGRVLGKPASECYRMHSMVCLGRDISATEPVADDASRGGVEDRFMTEVAEARLLNRSTRKDLKKKKKSYRTDCAQPGTPSKI